MELVIAAVVSTFTLIFCYLLAWSFYLDRIEQGILEPWKEKADRERRWMELELTASRERRK